MGRPPIGKVAMSGAERIRRYRARHGKETRPRGRPKGSVKGEPSILVGLRLQPDLVRALDLWRESRGLTRAAAVRLVIERVCR
jgi:hypothetical protein